MKEKRKLNIWYFHHYATPVHMSGLHRPSLLGEELVKKNNEVTVFAASYLHYSDVNLIKDKKKYILDTSTNLDFVFVNTPSSAKSYFARILNMFLYYKRLFSITKKYRKENKKPDVIIASSPHPLTMIAGIKIAKKNKIPCICEVRDFWPEVFFLGGIVKEKSILGKLLLKGEKWIYSKADALIFLKEGDKEYIKERKWDIASGGDIDLEKCYYINNGVNIEEFEKQINENKIYDKDLENDKFKVIYTGAIRPINNIDNILNTAKLLKDKNIEFLIYGIGNQVDRLKERIKKEKIYNVKLKGYIEKKYIPFVLSKASVNLLNYSNDKYNWSRGNSSNKLFEYMAAGKPIISTIKMGYCPLKKYNCGMSVTEYNEKGLADTIVRMMDLPKEEYISMCKNSKKAANDFDYKNLSAKLENVILKVCRLGEKNET